MADGDDEKYSVDEDIKKFKKQKKIKKKITNQKYHYHKQDDNGRIFDIAQWSRKNKR